MTQWRRAYTENGVSRGIFTLSSGVGAPNVDYNCTKESNNPIGIRAGSTPLADSFKSPQDGSLSGSLNIKNNYATYLGLDYITLHPVGIKNFTADNQIIIWATGEYAVMQDRRIYPNFPNFSEYNQEGIDADYESNQ